MRDGTMFVLVKLRLGQSLVRGIAGVEGEVEMNAG